VPGVIAKILIGEFGGVQSPVSSPYVKCSYMDIEAKAKCQIPLPTDLPSKWIVVYEGKGRFGKEAIQCGEVVQIRGEMLDVEVEESIGFLLLQGAPIGEPVCQHGPFVMTTDKEIREAFHDYQTGQLATKKAQFKLYD